MAKAIGVGGVFLKARDPEGAGSVVCGAFRHPGSGRRLAGLRRAGVGGDDRLCALSSGLELTLAKALSRRW